MRLAPQDPIAALWRSIRNAWGALLSVRRPRKRSTPLRTPAPTPTPALTRRERCEGPIVEKPPKVEILQSEPIAALWRLFRDARDALVATWLPLPSLPTVDDGASPHRKFREVPKSPTMGKSLGDSKPSFSKSVLCLLSSWDEPLTEVLWFDSL
uniref:Uncharacterized protein n=1 Tax=Trieres chinensis TaxID=1514140 RepID=A0A7S1ZQ33_TRICV